MTLFCFLKQTYLSLIRHTLAFYTLLVSQSIACYKLKMMYSKQRVLSLSNLDIQFCVYLPVDSRCTVDVITTEDSRTIEVLHHTEQTSSVPVICHTATIINLSCSVF